MGQYYLMAQLPSLDGLSETTPLPISEEEFYEVCSRFLNAKQIKILKSLTLVPSKTNQSVGSALVAAWDNGERQLRLALGQYRADKLKKPFDMSMSGQNISPQILQIVRSATEMKDPLSAEKYLNQYRVDFLETLRPMDAFSIEAVYYYGIKLKLLCRIRAFDVEKGKQAYGEIYQMIIKGEEQEIIK